jgi:hypothetical protein
MASCLLLKIRLIYIVCPCVYPTDCEGQGRTGGANRWVRKIDGGGETSFLIFEYFLTKIRVFSYLCFLVHVKKPHSTKLASFFLDIHFNGLDLYFHGFRTCLPVCGLVRCAGRGKQRNS